MDNKFVFKSKNSNKEKHNKDCFEDYLQNFDYLKLKYLPFFNGIDEKSGFDLSENTRKRLEDFEKTYRYSSIVKKKYSYIEDNLYLVYGDRELVHNDTLAYHYVMNNFINKFLAIPQLDKMFDEDYFNFEWDMHVGQNFREHRNDYNRDHFIHQMRNLYMMMVLLNKFGFFEASNAALQDETNGKISEFTIKKFKEFENLRSLPLRDVLDDVREDIGETLEKNICEINATEAEKLMLKRCRDNKNYREHYFYKYIIFASSILAALFHDMGYPICHFLEIRQRVSDYNPTMYMFTHNAIDSFDQIASKLSDSLLFKIVSENEIKQSLNMNKQGRYNHGSYSAIAFLLQFYNNGAIYSLSPEKQCAIELAAVAIYNHTTSFSCIDENNKLTDYYQPVFNQNPVSFLLRFCDDLQEWDRRYFEFFSDTDLSFCSDCLTPFVPIDIDNADNKNDTQYKCRCEEEKVFKSNSFLRRKLYVVRVCDSVNVEQNNDVLIFKVNYDLYKLIKVSRINSTYAKYRAKELNNIKRLIRNQDFIAQSNGTFDFKRIFIDFFMTANPLLIKIKILENYTCSINKANELSSLSLDNIFEDIFTEDAKDTELYKYMNSKLKELSLFDFYKELLMICIKNEGKDLVPKEINEIVEKYIPQDAFGDDDFYCKCMRELVYDCIYQYSRKVNAADLKFEEKDDYYSQFESEKSRENMLYNNISIFCNRRNLFNKEQAWGNYYTDLYFFYTMNAKANSNFSGGEKTK